MPRILLVFVCSAVLALAGCSSGASSPPSPKADASAPSQAPSAAAAAASATPSQTASPTPSPTMSATPTASPTAAPTPGPTPKPSASRAADPCRPTKKAGTVAVRIVDFAFKPAAIKARVGQVITFRNTGFEPHAPTLDTVDCLTPTLDTGQSAGLVFSSAGTFAFHCVIHGWMTGTIAIRP